LSLIITREELPLDHELFAGNETDVTTANKKSGGLVAPRSSLHASDGRRATA
jgi:hypothetical protein